MQKHPEIESWELDERYQGLPYETKKEVVGRFLDREMAKDKRFSSLNEGQRNRARELFFASNLPAPPPDPLANRGPLARLTGKGAAPREEKPPGEHNLLHYHGMKTPGKEVERRSIDDVSALREATEQFGSGLRGVTGAVIGTRASLTRDPEKRAELMGRYDDLQAQSMEKAPTVAFTEIVDRDEEGNIKPFQTARRAHRWALNTSAQMVPIVGSILAGAAVGAKTLGAIGLGATLGAGARFAVHGAGKAIQRAGMKGLGGTMATASDKAIAAWAGSTMGSYSVGHVLYAGSLYGDITAMGGSHEEARNAAHKYAVPAAAVSIVVPMAAQMSVMGYMGPAFAKKRVRDIALKAGLGTITEGLAEGVAESFVIAGEMDVLGEIYTPEEIRHRVIEAAAAGALMGAGMGIYGGTGRPKGDVNTIIEKMYPDLVAAHAHNNPTVIQYVIDSLSSVKNLPPDRQAMLDYLTTHETDVNAPINREMQRMQNMAIEVVKRGEEVNLARAQELAPKAEQGALTPDEALEMAIIMANSPPAGAQAQAAQAKEAEPKASTLPPEVPNTPA